jgi:osmotically-inducible protein OsmY
MTTKCDHVSSVCDGSHNTQLQQEVSQQLGHHGLRRINVVVDNHRITFSGTVHSYYMKQIVQETARNACPELRVYNDVDVVKTLS